MNGNALSLLGLALRGGRLAVGEEPVALAARSGQARLILLASDAAGRFGSSSCRSFRMTQWASPSVSSEMIRLTSISGTA